MPGMLKASLTDDPQNTDLIELPVARSLSLKRLRSNNDSSSERNAVVHDLRNRRIRKQAAAKSPVSVASCALSFNHDDFSTSNGSNPVFSGDLQYLLIIDQEISFGQEYLTSNDIDVLARQISYSREDVPVFENIDDIGLSDWSIQQENSQSANRLSQQLRSSLNGRDDDSRLLKEALLLIEDEGQEVQVMSNPLQDSNNGNESPNVNIRNTQIKQKEPKKKERVRGSYRCSRCGLPKANHICQVTIANSVSIQTSNAATIVDVSSSGILTPFSGERFVSISGGWKRNKSNSGSPRSRGGGSSSATTALGDEDDGNESTASLSNQVEAIVEERERVANVLLFSVDGEQVDARCFPFCF